jgi:peptide/nickel transport system permease protein
MSVISPLADAQIVPGGSPASDPASGRPPRVLRRIVRRPMGAIALTGLLVIVLACAFAPLIAPFSPNASSLTAELQGPSWHHLLGTDELGRDILSRLLYGGRTTLLAAALATSIAVALGTALGVFGGYRGRAADRAVSFWADLLLTMPVLVVLIVVVSVYQSSLYPAMLMLGILLSAAPTRVLRAVTLAIREDLYIEAARVSGLSHRQIMVRHVLPRVSGPIVVQATLAGAVSVVIASGLAFLGFGVQVPAPSWGTSIAEAASQYQEDSWFLIPVGGVILLTVLSLGLLGDVTRDVVAEQWTGTRPRRRRRSRRARTRRTLPERPGAVVDTDPTEASETPAILAVRGLSVSAPHPGGGPDLLLVEGLSFDVHAGATVSLVGESGCGKSVTARALLGVPPSGGTIGGSVRFDGSELVGASETELQGIRGRRVGFIGQDPAASLDPSQKIGPALCEVIRLYSDASRSEAQKQALALLRSVRIDDPERVVDLYPHQISGGMAQRVTIARALAGDPEVLIADEPTTALDVTVQAEILSLLRSLQESRGIAILLITHDWGVVAGLADEVLVMYAGQSVESAEAEVIFDRPRHPYTQALLRSNPHLASEPGVALPAIPGTVPAPADWPPSCRFASRCDLRTDECERGSIPMNSAGPAHTSRCIHIDRLVQSRDDKS